MKSYSEANFQMAFMATRIAAGTTNTTMLLKIDLRNNPTPGIRPRLTMPASINAIEATRNGVVSFAVKLNNPTRKPRITNVVIRTSGAITLRNSPATIAINNPTKKA